jgi:hypothetical protein
MRTKKKEKKERKKCHNALGNRAVFTPGFSQSRELLTLRLWRFED